jgi:cobalamin biosynthesis Co2+ chelatase CbiK
VGVVNKGKIIHKIHNTNSNCMSIPERHLVMLYAEGYVNVCITRVSLPCYISTELK